MRRCFLTIVGSSTVDKFIDSFEEDLVELNLGEGEVSW